MLPLRRASCGTGLRRGVGRGTHFVGFRVAEAGMNSSG